jgi:hypothetical protein
VTEQDKRNALIVYRLDQATETYEEAVFLLESGKSLRVVTNDERRSVGTIRRIM